MNLTGYGKKVVGTEIRAGFTMVELVAALAIIGILVALLLPAVQSIRESARRAACLNNLRQITLGVLGYSSAHRQFPPGTLGFSEAYAFEDHWHEPSSEYFWMRAQHTSAVALILPFLDQGNLYEIPDPVLYRNKQFFDELAEPGIEWFGEVDGFLGIATQSIPLLLCPADDIETAANDPALIVQGGSQPVTDSTGTGMDAVSWVIMNDWFDMREVKFGLTNYLGCAGAHSGGKSPDPERRPYTGILSSREPRRPNEITDGLSNTLLFGETVGWIVEGKRHAACNWFNGGLARARGGIPWMLETHPTQWHLRHLGDKRNSYAVGFGSKHPLIVNFSKGDGSVRSLSREMNWITLYQLSGAFDGTVVRDLD